MRSLVSSIKRIEKKTWVEKVTDDTNRWLRARNLEKDGQLEDAVLCYLEDADQQRKKNVLRSALSFTCSARCLLRLGRIAEASRYFAKAAELYEARCKSLQNESEDRKWLLKRASYCRQKALVKTGASPGGPA